jgi:hypothetical protein
MDEYFLNCLPFLIDKGIQQTLRTCKSNNPTYIQAQVDQLVAEAIQSALTSVGGEETLRGTTAVEAPGPSGRKGKELQQNRPRSPAEDSGNPPPMLPP